MNGGSSADWREEGPLTASDVFNVLASPLRRQVLFALAERDGIDEEVVFGALQERDSSDEVQEMEFRHIHLPKLVASRYVKWDRQRGHLERGDAFGQVAPLIHLIDSNPDVVPADWRHDPDTSGG